MKADNESQVVEIPIDGILDLHTFNPSEIKELLPHYLLECRKMGILDLRIIHGKGNGVMRETVHAILRKTAEVESFGLAGEGGGQWGATTARLRK